MFIKETFVNIIIDCILKDTKLSKYYSSKFPNSKYSLKSIIVDILYVLKTGISWRDLRSTNKWQSVYYHFNRFIKFDIFKKIFFKFRNKVKHYNPNILIIDSTFICNKFGKNKLGRNKCHKNEN